MSRRRVVLKSNLKKVLLDLLVSGQGRNLSFSNKKNKKQQQQQQQQQYNSKPKQRNKSTFTREIILLIIYEYMPTRHSK